MMPVKIHDHVTDKPFACWPCEYATAQRMWQKAIRDLADTSEALEEAQAERDAAVESYEGMRHSWYKEHDVLLEAQGKLKSIGKQIGHWERWGSSEQHELAWLVNTARILRSKEGEIE